jgi:hypothetical protein
MQHRPVLNAEARHEEDVPGDAAAVEEGAGDAVKSPLR